MQTYLVGGAVRDQLLKRPVTEKDWVVVGATPEEMLDAGYQQVGKDFPVFLHPETRDEYALARTERKSGRGYYGFETHFSRDVTLEEDLLRRDLTINAMAQDEQGKIIDPYGGQRDLQSKVLRHVSDAFIEDPLRVLRVARFAARYAHLGFSVAPDTQSLMRDIVTSDELKTLNAERVWKETSRAVMEPSPQVFFQVLKDCAGLRDWFGEIDALWGVPNPAKWHPEIDTGVHTMMVLEQAALLSDELPVRFAALTHDLGKALTPAETLPSHPGHEQKGLPLVKALCERLKVPNDCKELALLACEYHGHIHKAFELQPKTLLKVINACDAWRRPERFMQLLTACRADSQGRTGFETRSYPQADYVWQAFEQCNAIDVQDILKTGAKGAEIKDALTKFRLGVLKAHKLNFPMPSG